MGIQINGNTNNINAGIGSLSIEDLNELDIVGVATASNFKTGVSNLHNVGLTLSGGQIDVGSNIKIGTAGVVTATSFVGSGANLTSLPSQVTISNNADNRVITGGSGVNLNGEANLTFDGNTLQNLQSGAAAILTLKATSNSFNSIILDSNRTAANDNLSLIDGRWNGTVVSRIQFITGSDTSNKDDGYMAFHTRTSGASLTERLRITSDGKVGINQAPTRELSLHSPDNNNALIHFTNDDTGETASDGILFGLNGNEDCILNHQESGKNIILYTHDGSSGSERLRIKSDGNVDIGGGTHSRNLTVHAATNSVILIEGASNGTSNLMFGDENDEDVGMLGYNHGSNYLAFTVNAAERLRIGSDGKFIHSCTGAEGVDFGTTSSNGAYIKFDLSASGATTGYIGAGNQIVTGAAVADFGFRSQGNMVFATGGDVQRLSIDSSGGGVTSTGDIRVDRGTTGSDGLLGQAYGGYFGIKHADQTYGSEYMMISNDNHTYISCSTGSSIYIRPSANSSAHETLFAHDNSTFKTNIVMHNHAFRRDQHHWGHMEGGQNNIAATDAKSSPIYTIGSSYNPSDAALGNMYGIGFSHGNASFTPSGAGWGMYVASDGNSRIFLDGSNGRIYFDVNSRYLSEPTGDYGTVQVNGSGKGNWEGYSIDGRATFMHDGSVTTGIYNDVNNEWMVHCSHNAAVTLYYNGSETMRTTGEGILVSRDIRWSNSGTWTGEATNGKIQVYAGHMYFQNAGTTTVWVFRNNAGTEKAQVLANGNYNPLSDVSVKKDITTVNGALNTVKQLTGRTFTFKDDDSKSAGVIAQELEPIIPDLVNSLPSTDINGGVALKTVNYTGLSAYFIEAIKELSAKVEALEAKVATLEGS